MIHLADLIEPYLDSLSVNGASPNTVRAYRADLAGLLHHHREELKTATSWALVENVMAHYLTQTRASTAPKTTQRRLTSFRSFAAFSGAPAGFLSKYKAPTAGTAVAHPIPEGTDGVLAMINSTDRRSIHHRALFALTGLCGLRVSEACAIGPEQVDIATMEITVRGKGDKTRVVPISQKAWPYISAALAHAVVEGGSLVKMTESGARKSVRRYGRKALGHATASHDLRMTYGTKVYGATKDIRVTQELLGHASSKTTEGYTLVSEDSKRAAVELV